MKQLKVLYFAQLAEQLGTHEEALSVGSSMLTVGELQMFIATRGERWAAVGDKNIRMAINHTLCKHHQPLHNGDEVAFFPPVTGG